MPTQCSTDCLDFGTSAGRRLVGGFDGGAITSNGGALLLGAADRAIKLTERVARCFRDLRAPEWIVHPLENLIRQRVFGLALAYEDLVDHDQLRFDPALTATLGRPEGALAGKSTLNRLEHAGKIGAERNHKIDHDPQAFEKLFVDLFLDAYRAPRSFMVIDLDATDDPLYGNQEGRHFHGYYDCYCYLPLYIFCDRHLLAAKLRSSSLDAAAGIHAADGAAAFLYERLYCQRGEMENRIKECQADLFADRTPTPTMRANQLRLWLSSLAYVLLCAVRRIGLCGTRLENATCGTIRLQLLKIGALVTVSVRRVKVAFASSCPSADIFARAQRRLCSTGA